MANTANAVATSLYKNLPFNFSTDLCRSRSSSASPLLMLVHPSVPAKTVPEFIAYAKANPGKVNMGSGGKGATGHVSGELFQMMAGLKFQHVPYRGEAMAMTDLIGGQVQLGVHHHRLVDPVRQGRQAARARRHHRDALGPCCPRCRRSAISCRATSPSSWSGLTAPKDTPAESSICSTRKSTRPPADPTIKARFIDLGGPPVIGLARRLRQDHPRRHREVGQGGRLLRRDRELN